MAAMKGGSPHEKPEGLTGDASQFLAEVRGLDGPGPTNRRRVHGTLMRRVAAGGAAAGTVLGAKAAAAGSAGATVWAASTVAKGVVVSALALSVGTGAVVYGSGVFEAPVEPGPASPPGAPTSVASSPSAPSKAASVADAESAPDAESASQTGAELEPAPQPARRGAARKPASAGDVRRGPGRVPGPTLAPPPVPATPRLPALGAELEALDAAQAALARGDHARALELTKGPSGGGLSEERQATRVLALCGAGQLAAGKAARARFLAAHPGSPLAGRVRGACRGEP